MKKDIMLKLENLEELIENRLDDIEEKLNEKYGIENTFLVEECIDSDKSLAYISVDKHEFDYSGMPVRYATWTLGRNVEDDRTWYFTCRAMAWNFFKFRLWEDGQFQMTYAAKNRSGHARWITNPRLTFEYLNGTPDPRIPGSKISFNSIGGKRGKYWTTVQSGRWDFGRKNFDLLTEENVIVRASQRCRRTR